jgi:hypothetical protein
MGANHTGPTTRQQLPKRPRASGKAHLPAICSGVPVFSAPSGRIGDAMPGGGIAARLS